MVRRLKRGTPSQPPRETPERRIEELGRALASRGARVYLQPTVATRTWAQPVHATLALATAACALGVLAPHLSVLLLLLLALAVVQDADGGRSWLRRLLPRKAGWVVEADLTPDRPVQTPTLILWAPVARRQPGPLSVPRAARVALALPLATGLLAALTLLVDDVLAWELLDRVVLVLAGVELAWLLVAAVLLGMRRPLRVESDPAAMLSALSTRLSARPLAGVRVLVVVGTEGAAWFDDLEVWLRNRRHRYERSRTLLVALQPGNGPLGVVDPDGVLRPRGAPARVARAIADAGLPPRTGRTAALRARRVGLRAVGIQGSELQPGSGPERLEAALRSLARLLHPEDA